jgi:ketosteroid isomerase-like protein
MSQENVAIVRAALDALDRGDWDAGFKDAAPDIEVDNTRDLGEWRGVHRGPDQMVRAWIRFTEPWESVDLEVEQLIDAGDVVVSSLTGILRGRDGIEVQTRTNWLWRLSDGQVTHLVTGYETTEEALEAAGLSE